MYDIRIRGEGSRRVLDSGGIFLHEIKHPDVKTETGWEWKRTLRGDLTDPDNHSVRALISELAMCLEPHLPADTIRAALEKAAGNLRAHAEEIAATHDQAINALKAEATKQGLSIRGLNQT